jgi:hypothetical protein
MYKIMPAPLFCASIESALYCEEKARIVNVCKIFLSKRDQVRN